MQHEDVSHRMISCEATEEAKAEGLNLPKELMEKCKTTAEARFSYHFNLSINRSVVRSNNTYSL